MLSFCEKFQGGGYWSPECVWVTPFRLKAECLQQRHTGDRSCFAFQVESAGLQRQCHFHLLTRTTQTAAGAAMLSRPTLTSLGMTWADEEVTIWWLVLPSSARDTPGLLNRDVTLNTVSPGRPLKNKTKPKNNQIRSHTSKLSLFCIHLQNWGIQP